MDSDSDSDGGRIDVEDIMDLVGDTDIIICSNLGRKEEVVPDGAGLAGRARAPLPDDFALYNPANKFATLRLTKLKGFAATEGNFPWSQ